MGRGYESARLVQYSASMARLAAQRTKFEEGPCSAIWLCFRYDLLFVCATDVAIGADTRRPDGSLGSQCVVLLSMALIWQLGHRTL